MGVGRDCDITFLCLSSSSEHTPNAPPAPFSVSVFLVSYLIVRKGCIKPIPMRADGLRNAKLLFLKHFATSSQKPSLISPQSGRAGGSLLWSLCSSIGFYLGTAHPVPQRGTHIPVSL